MSSTVKWDIVKARELYDQGHSFLEIERRLRGDVGHKNLLRYAASHGWPERKSHLQPRVQGPPEAKRSQPKPRPVRRGQPTLPPLASIQPEDDRPA